MPIYRGIDGEYRSTYEDPLFIKKPKRSPEEWEIFLDGCRSELIESLDFKDRQKFYITPKWKKLREEFIKDKELVCVYCSVDLTLEGKIVNIDHIEPIKYSWKKRLDPNNLQIVCNDCNCEKGNKSDKEYKSILQKTKLIKEKNTNLQIKPLFKDTSNPQAAFYEISLKNEEQWQKEWRQQKNRISFKEFCDNKFIEMFPKKKKGKKK